MILLSKNKKNAFEKSIHLYPYFAEKMAPRGEEAEVEGEGGSPPGAPLNLEVVDWDATTVRLK